jgi:purine-nucleoside phosphorylase
MCWPYDRELVRAAEQIALDERIRAHRGVYVAVAGPNLETRAEYRFLRGIGADVVGMSTVPEVIVGVHAGMRILGLSVVTDVCFPDALQPADIPDIIRTANEAEPKLRTIVRRVVAELP